MALQQDSYLAMRIETRSNGVAVVTLINFLVEDSEIFDKALACADQLAAGPAEAISASKVPINHYIRMISNLVLPLSLSLEGESMRSPDAVEAQRAFVEKPPPTFGMR